MLWCVTYPGQVLGLIHQLKMRLRQYIVQREGQRGWSQLARNFREKTAKAGYSSELVNEILEDHRETIVEKLGNQWADEILGK